MARAKSDTAGPAWQPRRVLVLQGGGALGSYQAGVFEALDGCGFCPQWVAGISIGAINAALIAGNPPERRLARLREFWDLVTSGLPVSLETASDGLWQQWHQAAAAWTALAGAPGFFRPVWPPALPWLPGTTAWYDTAPLRETLERLVDWDLLNSGGVRLSVGAVNVETGNFLYFDTARQRLGPEHVMASGALPPGLPPVQIDGQWWWDGGLVSNTPLDHVLAEADDEDLLVFQVDLFRARGAMPTSIAEAEERVADIRFSSRTRFTTDVRRRESRIREAFARLAARLPPELAESEDARFLAEAAREGRIAVAHLIYRDKPWQGSAKSREFSRATMLSHWAAGRADVDRGLVPAPWDGSPPPPGIATYDLTQKAD